MKSILAGITGGIGSGKSVVSKICKTLGYPVYDADKAAAQILDKNPEVISAVTALIGSKAYQPDGLPDRPHIASVVFSQPEKLEKLNAIIHPAVHDDFQNWVARHRESGILFKEAAIMFESGSYLGMDCIIAVTAPELLRIKRVMSRDRKNEDQVRQIISRQLPEKELTEKSDFVIVNDETRLLIPQVLAVIEKIKKLKES